MVKPRKTAGPSFDPWSQLQLESDLHLTVIV